MLYTQWSGGAVNAVKALPLQELPPQEQQSHEAQFNAVHGNYYQPRR